jgi:hypothetical protein
MAMAKERDLVIRLGQAYEDYRQRTPAFIPGDGTARHGTDHGFPGSQETADRLCSRDLRQLLSAGCSTHYQKVLELSAIVNVSA